MIAWAMLARGAGPWRYLRAEAPCWKGEIGLSFGFVHLTIGWQRSGLTGAQA